eukprot:34013-Eustigmatos_ZCMA.PRE.1
MAVMDDEGSSSYVTTLTAALASCGRRRCSPQSARQCVLLVPSWPCHSASCTTLEPLPAGEGHVHDIGAFPLKKLQQ